MNEKKKLILEYITEDECNYMADDILFDCTLCSCFEDCYMKSCEKCNGGFAESVDYDGCSTEEEPFYVYKIHKEGVIKQVAQKEHNETNITERCYRAMMDYEVEITD